jgi:hypothetical protein
VTRTDGREWFQGGCESCTQIIWGFCVFVTSHLKHTIITLNHHSCACFLSFFIHFFLSFFLSVCLSVFHWISWITPSLFCTLWVSVLSQDRLTGREGRERERERERERVQNRLQKMEFHFFWKQVQGHC